MATTLLISLWGCTSPDIQETKPSAELSDTAAEALKPNIIIFYADDLGYGDLSAYGATAVTTPNIDALSAHGIRYTDAHSPAATCTPSRYSLLTGEFAFRNNAAILPGDAPLIIDPERPTLPKMLQQVGYTTAVVGKWHLGLGRGEVDWNQAVKPGPLEIGFDYSFLIPATGDRVPTAYLENHHIVGLDPNDPIEVSYETNISDRPLGTEHPELLKQQADLQHSGSIINGISRIGWMRGGKDAEWRDEDFPIVMTDKAISFIDENQSAPFMLFFPFNDIHVPRVPNERFQGATDMGPRGDAIVQMDWMTGRIIDALEKRGLMDNTLIIFSSDNGPVLDDGYADQAVERIGDHQPAGPFSGGKYSVHEGGTRVPMITYYAGQKRTGESDALISHIDFYASLAKMVGYPLANTEAIDSENILPALMDATADGREEMLEEAFAIGLRQGNWKYIAPFSGDLPDWLANKEVRTGIGSEPLLYNLDEDLKEQHNLADAHPERTRQMAARLEAIKQRTERESEQ
ncbi:arylsulfatase [Alteromonas aestuariivivens]|uniref:Arylsulfatase n=1 Tax=Alteromonas aestuariivivens TaxID=1938339 RepID=A0A3D8MCG8_9ALTE|nr:arylsulfatase [Alteromonas aestuariivivens]RDV27985.1 arylsulfatase [Alteromonas aestuariivivens]